MPGRLNIDSIRRLDTSDFQKSKTQSNNKEIGLYMDPQFEKPGNTTLTDPLQLKTFFNYRISQNSALRQNGIDLNKLFGINTGGKDFNQRKILENGIGASF